MTSAVTDPATALLPRKVVLETKALTRRFGRFAEFELRKLRHDFTELFGGDGSSGPRRVNAILRLAPRP